MININRKLDQTEIECDGDYCNNSFDVEGTWFKDATDKMKQKGWKIKKINGEWKHFCSDCVENSGVTPIW